MCVRVCFCWNSFKNCLRNRSKIPHQAAISRFAIFILIPSNPNTHTHAHRRRIFFRRNRYAIINRILTLYNACVYCCCIVSDYFVYALELFGNRHHSNTDFFCQFSSNLLLIDFLSLWDYQNDIFFFSLIIIIHKLKAKFLFLWAKCMIMSDFYEKKNLHMNSKWRARERERIFDMFYLCGVSF